MLKPLANSAAEHLIISSIISDANNIDIVASKIGPQDFYDARISTLYSAVARLALVGKSGAVDLIEELRACGELDSVGGEKAVNYLSNKGISNVDKVKEAATVVKDLSVKRERATQAQKVASKLADGVDASAEIDMLTSHGLVKDAEGWTDLGGIVSAIVSGTHVKLEPTILRRKDGAALLYKSRLNWISAPPESMKSWLAKLACVQLMELGEPSIYVDFEEADGTSCAERIVSIALGRGHSIDTVKDWVEGVEVDGVRDSASRLFFYRAATSGLEPQARSQILRLARNLKISLVVLDGVSSAMSSHEPSLEEDRARDVNLWLSGFAWPLVGAGACVLCVDHVTKNSNATAGSFSARAPRGSGAKLAAVSGTALSATVKQPGSAWTEGVVDLFVQKDRPGRVKIANSSSGARSVGTLYSTPKVVNEMFETVVLEIHSPAAVAETQQAKRWDLILAQMINQLLKGNGEPMSKTAIREELNDRRKAKGGTGWRGETFTAAFDFLTSKGWCTVEKESKTQMLACYANYLSEYGDTAAPETASPF